jgi:predicted transcriptional regulator
MRGQFVNGRIEVEGETYPDGTVVEFVVRDDNGDLLELTPEQEAELEESIEQIERGECITAEEMLARIRAMRTNQP